MINEQLFEQPAAPTPDGANTRREGIVKGRVLHLADVENLLGAAHFTSEQAGETYAAYDRVAPHGEVDQIVLATSHHAARAAWFGWPPSARRRVRSGENGADIELLAVLQGESVEKRFHHIVIGSGDGIFALPAAILQAAGVKVTVVTRRDSLSRSLRLAVRDIRFIESPAPPDREPVTVPRVA